MPQVDEGYDAVRLLLRVGILEWCNLELLRVGVYRVEVSSSLLFPGRAPLHGAPLHFSSAPLRLHALSRGRCCELDAGVPLAVGEVDEDAPCFRTRALHVRFGDEAHALNEAATFAFEGAPPPAACPPGASLLVRFRLLRAPPPQKEDGGGGGGGGGGAFELCAVRTLRLPGERALRGVRAWAPVCWGAAHLALAGVTLHSAVVAARFVGAPPAPRRPPELAHAEARAARAAREEEDARRGVPGAAAARFVPTGSAGVGGGGGGARGGGALAARGFSGGAAPPPRGGDGASRLPPWAAAYTAALRARAAAPLSLCEALAAPAAGGDGDGGDGAAPDRARPAELFAAALGDALGVVVGEGEGEPVAARRAAAAFERVRGAEAALAAAETAAAAWAAPGGCGGARAVDAHAWAARWCTLLPPLAAAAAASEAWRAEAREAAEAALAECSGRERGAAAGETYSTSRFFGVGGAWAASPPAASAAPPPSPPPPPPPPLAGAAAAALEAALSAAGAAAEGAWRALCAALLSTGDLSVAPLQRSFRDSAAAWARAACAPAGAGAAPAPLAALPRAPPAALAGPLPEGPFPPPPLLPRERCLDAAAECAPFALRAVAMEYGGGGGGGGGAGAASRQRSPPPPGTHAVVFVSGLGGGRADLRCLRAALKVHHPRLFCVCAGDSVCGAAGEGDLLAVGLALAAEVAAAVSPEALAAEGVPPLRALSFVCFSMGGVWARVALRARALAHVRPLLHAFVTFASPHLGFPPAAAGHALVAAGAFFSRLAGRLPVLQQLSHGDRGADGAPSLLELLAEGWGEGGGGGAPAAALAAAGLAPVPNGALLAPARHVVLAGSPQDSYSPLASALAAAPAPGAAGERAAAAFWRGLEGPAAGGAARRVWRVSVHFSEWHSSGAPAAARAEAAGLLPPPRDAGSAPPPPPPTSLSAAASQGVASVFNSVSGRGAHLGFCGSEELGALLALAPPFAQCWEDD